MQQYAEGDSQIQIDTFNPCCHFAGVVVSPMLSFDRGGCVSCVVICGPCIYTNKVSFLYVNSYFLIKPRIINIVLRVSQPIKKMAPFLENGVGGISEFMLKNWDKKHIVILKIYIKTYLPAYFLLNVYLNHTFVLVLI